MQPGPGRVRGHPWVPQQILPRGRGQPSRIPPALSSASCPVPPQTCPGPWPSHTTFMSSQMSSSRRAALQVCPTPAQLCHLPREPSLTPCSHITAHSPHGFTAVLAGFLQPVSPGVGVMSRGKASHGVRHVGLTSSCAFHQGCDRQQATYPLYALFLGSKGQTPRIPSLTPDEISRVPLVSKPPGLAWATCQVIVAHFFQVILVLTTLNVLTFPDCKCKHATLGFPLPLGESVLCPVVHESWGLAAPAPGNLSLWLSCSSHAGLLWPPSRGHTPSAHGIYCARDALPPKY